MHILPSGGKIFYFNAKSNPINHGFIRDNTFAVWNSSSPLQGIPNKKSFRKLKEEMQLSVPCCIWVLFAHDLSTSTWKGHWSVWSPLSGNCSSRHLAFQVLLKIKMCLHLLPKSLNLYPNLWEVDTIFIPFRDLTLRKWWNILIRPLSCF